MTTNDPSVSKRAIPPSLLSPASRRAARETKFRFRGGAFKHATTNPILTALLAKPINGVSTSANKEQELSVCESIPQTSVKSKLDENIYPAIKRPRAQELQDETWEHRQSSAKPVSTNPPSASVMPSGEVISTKRMVPNGSSSSSMMAHKKVAESLPFDEPNIEDERTSPVAHSKPNLASKRKIAMSEAGCDLPKKKRKAGPDKPTANSKDHFEPATVQRKAESGARRKQSKLEKKPIGSTIEESVDTKGQDKSKALRTLSEKEPTNKAKGKRKLVTIAEASVVPNEQGQTSVQQAAKSNKSKHARGKSEDETGEDVEDEDPTTASQLSRKHTSKRSVAKTGRTKVASKSITKSASKENKKLRTTSKSQTQGRMPMPKLRAIDFNAYRNDGHESDDPLDCISVLD